jgi:WXG100 protein secretion system (Wss), protein YukD
LSGHAKVDQTNLEKHMSEHDNILKIKIQSTRGTKEFSFPKETKIAEVIAKAVEAFGFTPGDKFELVLASNPGEPLQPERTLVSYHITDGTALILTAVGGGV